MVISFQTTFECPEADRNLGLDVLKVLENIAYWCQHDDWACEELWPTLNRFTCSELLTLAGLLIEDRISLARRVVHYARACLEADSAGGGRPDPGEWQKAQEAAPLAAPTDDHSDSVIPFIADRSLSHANLEDLERVAREAEADPTITFEPSDLVTRTTSELLILAGMLSGRGMHQHARAVAKIAAEWRSATEEYLRDRSQGPDA